MIYQFFLESRFVHFQNMFRGLDDFTQIRSTDNLGNDDLTEDITWYIVNLIKAQYGMTIKNPFLNLFWSIRQQPDRTQSLSSEDNPDDDVLGGILDEIESEEDERLDSLGIEITYSDNPLTAGFLCWNDLKFSILRHCNLPLEMDVARVHRFDGMIIIGVPQCFSEHPALFDNGDDPLALTQIAIKANETDMEAIVEDALDLLGWKDLFPDKYTLDETDYGVFVTADQQASG